MSARSWIVLVAIVIILLVAPALVSRRETDLKSAYAVTGTAALEACKLMKD